MRFQPHKTVVDSQQIDLPHSHTQQIADEWKRHTRPMKNSSPVSNGTMLTPRWANSWTALTLLHIPHEISATILSFFSPLFLQPPEFQLLRGLALPSSSFSFWGLIPSVLGKAMAITGQPALKDSSHSKRALERYLWVGRSLKTGIHFEVVLVKKPAVLCHGDNVAYEHCTVRWSETPKGSRRL